jgi:hypothetical protein
MLAVACLAGLGQDHPWVGNTGEEVFAVGAVAAVVVVVVVVAAAADAVVAAAVVVVVAAAAVPHHCVVEAEAVVVVAVGLVGVEAGFQENVAVEFAAAVMGPLLLVHAVVLGEVVLAQDQVVLTVVEHKVREQVMSLYPVAVAVGPYLVAFHWPL